ncbi:MAG: TGS domain-containing protein, partial [Phycisphaerae bacterium]|nr:TGS domain-containing protein [Phycisphaerae bacterium]
MSVSVKLPDGSTLDYDQAVSAARVAADISPRLASAALAAEVDGRPCDLSAELADGQHDFKVITDRHECALEILRHTA